ncbi:MAG TPA: 50S ribosomal protein L13 [Anaerolineales bacterium]|nr:50S ribosomal protein L13 [Anaerolineales bacterium]
MQKTYFPDSSSPASHWVVVDADGQNLGRLASRVARVLMGKDKPDFTPGQLRGDFVIVINAEKVAVTGKRLDEKVYYRASGFPGGLKKTGLRTMLDRHPERVVESAVRGMLPHNRYGRRLLGRLKVYPGPNHPHEAQKPAALAGS